MATPTPPLPPLSVPALEWTFCEEREGNKLSKREMENICEIVLRNELTIAHLALKNEAHPGGGSGENRVQRGAPHSASCPVLKVGRAQGRPRGFVEACGVCVQHRARSPSAHSMVPWRPPRDVSFYALLQAWCAQRRRPAALIRKFPRPARNVVRSD